MATFFTADTHFGHDNIIRYCDRPFSSVEEMDQAMITNWNAVVGRTDEVYHLGDFCLAAADPDLLLRKLNGRKHLIWGNHDRPRTIKAPGWITSRAMAEINVAGTTIILLHYGMRVWRKDYRGSLHFYGHSHSNLPGDSQCCDVGVDCWDFRPVDLPTIRARLATQPLRTGITTLQ